MSLLYGGIWEAFAAYRLFIVFYFASFSKMCKSFLFLSFKCNLMAKESRSCLFKDMIVVVKIMMYNITPISVWNINTDRNKRIITQYSAKVITIFKIACIIVQTKLNLPIRPYKANIPNPKPMTIPTPMPSSLLLTIISETAIDKEIKVRRVTITTIRSEKNDLKKELIDLWFITEGSNNKWW